MTSYTINSSSFKLRFREFRYQDDARIEMFIEEASASMDPTMWTTKADYITAFNYLAAHYLMRAIQTEESGTGQQVTSERIGADFSVTYSTPEQPSREEKTDFNTTIYGVRYAELRHLNFPAIAII